MKEKNNPSLMRSSLGAKMVLILLFPEYTVQIRKDYIALSKTVEVKKVVNGELQKSQQIEEHAIDNKNFEEFKSIIVKMFCLTNNQEQEYNPNGDIAQRIADKLRQGAMKRAALKGQQSKKIAILSRYASILAVGEQKDLNTLMQYTVYQLFDEFQRFELKINYDIYLQAKMAGAKDLKEVDQWMKDIHEND